MKTVPLQIFGARKSILLVERGEMFSSIKHLTSGRMVETWREIYEATMEHNKITLSQHKPAHEVYEVMTAYKVQYVELKKLGESEDEKDTTIFWEDYLETLKVLQARNKSCYANIKTWGPLFRIFVYWLMKRMYEREEIPDEFQKTSLMALYKKGPRSNLWNYQFLHLKECFAKVFESLVMNKVKADLWKSYPISQIGGCPRSRCNEHLYLLVSLMRMVESVGEWGLEGFIVIFKDVQKAFDRISVKQTATAKAGVEGKNLRILDKRNCKTTFSLVGDPTGQSFEGEWVSGQGTVFTCTACSKAMPDPMSEQIQKYKSEAEEPLGLSVVPDKVRIEEVDFVDDKGSIAKGPDKARQKGNLITRAMNEINVKCHSTKMRFMIIGKRKYVEEAEKDLMENPIKIQGHTIERTFSEKYLCMYINTDGLRATVREQMEFRIKQCQGKVAVIKSLMERLTMREIGYLAGLWTLFDSIVTSTAIYSAGMWVGAMKADMEFFDKKMKEMWYPLMRINLKTTFLQVCWECDLLPPIMGSHQREDKPGEFPSLWKGLSKRMPGSLRGGKELEGRSCGGGKEVGKQAWLS